MTAVRRDLTQLLQTLARQEELIAPLLKIARGINDTKYGDIVTKVHDVKVAYVEVVTKERVV